MGLWTHLRVAAKRTAFTQQVFPNHAFKYSTVTRSMQEAFSETSLKTPLSVRNTAQDDGRLALELPLPGIEGLSSISLSNDADTVQELIQALEKRDESLKSIDVTTTSGTKIARSVHIHELTAMNFVLRLNHFNVLVENGTRMLIRTNYRRFNVKVEQGHDYVRTRAEGNAFAAIKHKIESYPHPHLSVQEYYKMCLHAGAEQTVADKWLRELQRRNLLLHFDRSPNEELQSTLILRPYSDESLQTLRKAMDSELYDIQLQRKRKETQLHELKLNLKKAVAVDEDLRRAALRLPNAGKWVSGIAVTSIYGSLMYLVWDVYSWDVMEPVTYFIGFTGVIGNAVYHTMTKKDPTYTNMWQKNFRVRLDKLRKEHKFAPEKLEELQTQMERVEQDLEILYQWEGESRSSMTPS